MASVSIVIPIYNTEDYLEQCLESVIEQTFTDIEIICVLDGPTDQSALKVKKYAVKDGRVILIDQPNLGISAARNNGLKRATGEYVIFIDSDDWLAPDYIEKLYASACSTNAGMVICNFQRYQDQLSPNSQLPEGIFTPEEICRELVLDKKIGNYTWNKLIRKKIFTEHQITFPVGMIFEDMAVMSRIAYHSEKVAIINDYLYYYRIRSGSTLTTYDSKRFLDMFTALKMMKEFLIDQKIYQLYKPEFEYNCVAKFISTARLICRNNNACFNLLSQIRNNFYELFDGKVRVSPEVKKQLSIHRRISLWSLLFNLRFYKLISVWKLI